MKFDNNYMSFVWSFDIGLCGGVFFNHFQENGPNMEMFWRLEWIRALLDTFFLRFVRNISDAIKLSFLVSKYQVIPPIETKWVAHQ